MLDLNKSGTLVEAFEPGVGNNPERDNLAGCLANDLKRALENCLRAFCFEDTGYIDKRVLTAICNTYDWLENCLTELSRNEH